MFGKCLNPVHCSSDLLFFYFCFRHHFKFLYRELVSTIHCVLYSSTRRTITTTIPLFLSSPSEITDVKMQKLADFSSI